MAYIQTVPTRPRTGDAVSSGIVAATVLFLVILAVSAFWDPTIRVLHLFEALLPWPIPAWSMTYASDAAG